MIEFGLIGVLGGLLIGGRYKVFALVPAELLVFAVLLVQSVAGGPSLVHQILEFVAFTLCLQAGYAARIAVRTPASQAPTLARTEA